MTREKANEALVNAMRKHGATAIAKATKALVAAHRSRKPAATAGIELHEESDAYRVQDEVFAELWPGVRATAWKAGGPSDKVEPTASPIAPERLLRSPASVAAASMNMVGVEAEVAFRFAKDLPPRTRPYSERSIAAAIGEVLVVIELVRHAPRQLEGNPGPLETRGLPEQRRPGAGQRHEGLAKGRFPEAGGRIPDRRASGEGKGAHSFGNPLRLLPWLVKHCRKRGLSLHAGDVVTTGAWTGLEIAKAGDEVTAKFPGIGEATCTVYVRWNSLQGKKTSS
jgi:2-keto-4-pentenoate hydratase